MADSRSPDLRVFAVEDTSVQITWSRLPPGEVTVSAGDRLVAARTNGGAGAVTLDGLQPDRPYRLAVVGPGLPRGGSVLRVRTLTPPPGRELTRFSTLSDMHVGIRCFDIGQGMVERLGPDDEPHPLRCTRAAIDELLEWGAERVILKGDLTDRSAATEWENVGKLFSTLPVPVHAIPGNHDVKRRADSVPLGEASRLAGFPITTDIDHIDVPGLRIILVATCIPGHSRGHLTPERIDGITELAGTAGTPAMVVLHHELNRLPFIWFWPPGVPRRQAMTFLRRAAAANPRTFVTSGHTHRHRRRKVGPVVTTEVGSPKDYPGAWAGYVIHEGGMRQLVHRVEAPDCIAWTEYTRAAAFGTWGRWSPGRLSSRCFTHLWPV